MQKFTVQLIFTGTLVGVKGNFISVPFITKDISIGSVEEEPESDTYEEFFTDAIKDKILAFGGTEKNMDGSYNLNARNTVQYIDVDLDGLENAITTPETNFIDNEIKDAITQSVNAGVVINEDNSIEFIGFNPIDDKEIIFSGEVSITENGLVLVPSEIASNDVIVDLS